MSHESFTAVLALIGIVIIVSSLLSGAVERTGLPQVAIFLLVGALLGPGQLGLVELTLDSPALQVIATLGLVLVLFSDAIGVDIGELRQQRRLAALILVPGTLLPAALIALAAWALLGLPWPAAAILGAALASTDPVLLRTLIRHPGIPSSAKVGLRLESGMNDVILLPIVVLCMLVLRPGASAPAWEIGSRVGRPLPARPHARRVRRLGGDHAARPGAPPGRASAATTSRSTRSASRSRPTRRRRRWEEVGSSRRSPRGSSSRRSTWSCATASSTTARRRRRCSCC